NRPWAAGGGDVSEARLGCVATVPARTVHRPRRKAMTTQSEQTDRSSATDDNGTAKDRGEEARQVLGDVADTVRTRAQDVAARLPEAAEAACRGRAGTPRHKRPHRECSNEELTLQARYVRLALTVHVGRCRHLAQTLQFSPAGASSNCRTQRNAQRRGAVTRRGQVSRDRREGSRPPVGSGADPMVAVSRFHGG